MHSTEPKKPRPSTYTNGWCVTQRRNAAPSSNTKVAGSKPCQTIRAVAVSTEVADIKVVVMPTATRASTAKGQPSMSVTNGAPDQCSCSGIWCKLGSAHSHGSSTKVASKGVSSSVPTSMRHGLSHSDAHRQAKMTAISKSMVMTGPLPP